MSKKVMQGFSAILKTASKEKSIEQIFKTLDRELRKLVACDVTALAIPSRRNPCVICRTSAKTRARTVVVEPGFFTRTGIRRTLVSGRPTFKNATSAQKKEFKAVSCPAPKVIGMVPLVSRGQAVGVIVAARTGGQPFSKEDKAVTTDFALLAAPILHLFEINSLYEDAASLDAVTGLRNHYHLQLRLEEEIGFVDRYKGSFALLIIAIDGFRAFNEKYDYEAGTAALMKIARIIEDGIRNVDVAARYGGGSFAVLLTRCAPKTALGIAERTRQEIARTKFKTSTGWAKLTVSTGVAMYPTDSPLRSGIIEAAEVAVGWAKKHECNRTYVFSKLFSGK